MPMLTRRKKHLTAFLFALIAGLISLPCHSADKAATIEHGDSNPNNINQAWDSMQQQWLETDQFWLSSAEQEGGLTWGTRSEYPPYEAVKERDTMIIVTHNGPCMMEFFHTRWRRANDVRRWNEVMNDYQGCATVFD
ncbi:hypothetical protein SIN8267_01429 [Sinobacterium norvegicum]|uniref:Uncharacterized protein n=2 Tax=Sinobacterium norvegicum TaxID=1641715 RepID=A0ABM9ADN3_9GAMM|nr:hypothetical protein SIN8267_01429 [Sinobacterium norvegicum]